MAFNTTKILEVTKKNLFTVICAVVAIAAVVTTFWPLGGMMAGLQTLADGRAAIYTQLEGLQNQSRKLPLTDPTKTTQDDLTQFPNDKMLQEGQRVTDDVGKQSNAMVTFVRDLNAKSHVPLVDQVLPIAISPTAKFHFGDIYKLVLSVDPDESINTDPKLKEANRPNLRNDILNGGLPPTAVDITQAQKDLWDNVYSMRVVSQNGVQKNLPEIQAQYQEASGKLPDSMKTDIATKKKVYVDRDAFAINDTVIGTREPVPSDIWFAQLTLWLQQDIAQAIAQTNANSKSIIDAPIKHLMHLTIPINPTPYVGAVLNTTGTPIPPAAFDNGSSQPLPKNLTVSATGRISNPMYDVVQFTLVLRCDAAQIPTVIQTLGEGRLIDVYNVNQVSVDSIEAKGAGYIYGPLPVVQLTLNCEALFIRDWTVPLMPDTIRRLLSIPPPLPPAGQAVAQ